MMILDPLQEKFIDDIRQAMKSKRKILGRAPTGFGKTVCGSYMVNATQMKDKHTIFMVHRTELLSSTSKTFKKFDIPHDFIAPGKAYDPYCPVHIASVDTLKNRLDKVRPVDLFIPDEAHHTNAAGWGKVADWATNRGAFMVGLTATPWRLDGRGLGDYFDHMVHGPSVSTLIETGRLSKYRIFAAPMTPSTAGLKITMGDYNSTQLDALMDDKVLYGCAVDNWLKHAKGKRTIAFCPSINTSESLTRSFIARGVHAAHLDGKTDDRTRRDVIMRFADGELDVITNVNLFSEGFDLSAIADKDVPIDAVILYRQTTSLTLHLQQLGRALRKKPEAAIILDHVGNCMRLGLPDDDFDWTLDARKKKKKKDGEAAENIRQCPACYSVHAGGMRQCPECGHTYEVKESTTTVMDGDLREIGGDEMRQKKAELTKTRIAEERACKTLSDFQELGRQRGYKPGWAHICWKSKSTQ